MLKHLLPLTLMLGLLANPLAAQEIRAGDLRISQTVARATAPMARTGAVYLTVSNAGTLPDRLISASTAAAETVELHTTVREGNVMRMQPVPGIDVPAGQTVTLSPGGLHVMLIGLRGPLKDGSSLALSLTFQRAGRVDVTVPVSRAVDGGSHGHPPATHGPRSDASGTSQAADIHKLLRGTFDRPDAPLAIEPVVVAGDYALAGWAQGDMGGRALLMRKHGHWVIQFCSGDALKRLETLKEVGVPAPTASMLAAALAEAERRLHPQRVAQFSRFDGLVAIGEGGHPPAPGHAAHHPHRAAH